MIDYTNVRPKPNESSLICRSKPNKKIVMKTLKTKKTEMLRGNGPELRRKGPV